MVNVEATSQAVQEVSTLFSTNLTAYVIFISILFLAAFMFISYHLLNLFKNVLERLLSELLLDVKEIKDKVSRLEKEMDRK